MGAIHLSNNLKMVYWWSTPLTFDTNTITVGDMNSNANSIFVDYFNDCYRR